MTMRKTPYLRLHYPWASDVVAATDMQSMAQDIDQALVATASLGANFSRFASVLVQRAAAQSIPKATLTAVSFDTVMLNNGADSPLANGSWFSNANPTRLTAPSQCVVLACGNAGLAIGAALGTNGAVQATIALNGAAGAPGVQGSKWGPVSTDTGFPFVSAISMWKMAAGDFLELKLYWTGTPAGPFNTVTGQAPTLSLMMVALPSVA